MNVALTIISALIVIGWLILMLWSWFTPSPPSTTKESDPESDREIGYLVGLLGGSIETAAHVRYAISRLEEDLGRKATLHEKATAVGVTLGSGG
ncbi:MAG: hypothetical protein IPK32_20850 [Verrucomicrobiaceae bacterium]|nr:hypothetical protein [Verrucomicrobiaceae bacterium]